MRYVWLIAFAVLGCGSGQTPRTAELPHCRLPRGAPPPDCAPPSVFGTVVAAGTGEPIAGVEVFLGDGTTRTTTGPDGAFGLCGLAVSPVGSPLTLRYHDGSAAAILDTDNAVVDVEIREERWPTYIDPKVKRPRPGPDKHVFRLALCTPG